MTENIKTPKEILDIVQKSFKNKLSMSLGDDPIFEVKTIPTKIPLYDGVLGGGFKRGGLHIISGAFSTGKTFLCQKTIESAQSEGGICAWIDSERRYDPKWFALTGIKVEDLLVARPSTGEEAFQVLYNLLANAVDVIVIDSFAALLPNERAETDEITNKIGLQARLMSVGLQKAVTENISSVILATNQLRADIGTRFHPGMLEKMTGGNAQYYYASTITQVRRRGFITEKGTSDDESKSWKDKKIGFIMELLITKHNYAPPFGICQIPFNFTTGALDNLAAIIDVAIDMDIIVGHGAWYSYEGNKYQGKQGVYNWFSEDIERQDKLKFQVFG